MDGNDDAWIPFQSQFCDHKVDERRDRAQYFMILLCQNSQSSKEDGAAFTEIDECCSGMLLMLMS
jgi:hypothetical protein